MRSIIEAVHDTVQCTPHAFRGCSLRSGWTMCSRTLRSPCGSSRGRWRLASATGMASRWDRVRAVYSVWYPTIDLHIYLCLSGCNISAQIHGLHGHLGAGLGQVRAHRQPRPRTAPTLYLTPNPNPNLTPNPSSNPNPYPNPNPNPNPTANHGRSSTAGSRGSAGRLARPRWLPSGTRRSLRRRRSATPPTREASPTYRPCGWTASGPRRSAASTLTS